VKSFVTGTSGSSANIARARSPGDEVWAAMPSPRTTDYGQGGQPRGVSSNIPGSRSSRHLSTADPERSCSTRRPRSSPRRSPGCRVESSATVPRLRRAATTSVATIGPRTALAVGFGRVVMASSSSFTRAETSPCIEPSCDSPRSCRTRLHAGPLRGYSPTSTQRPPAGRARCATNFTSYDRGQRPSMASACLC